MHALVSEKPNGIRDLATPPRYRQRPAILLREVLRSRVVDGGVGNRLLASPILILEGREPLGLLRRHPATPRSPADQRCLADLQGQKHRARSCRAFRRECIAQLRDDLLRLVLLCPIRLGTCSAWGCPSHWHYVGPQACSLSLRPSAIEERRAANERRGVSCVPIDVGWAGNLEPRRPGMKLCPYAR